MSSHARSSREEERRLSVRTLIIASIASAMAAIITSQFWTSGTPIAAAITPVIVTLVSELLHRPTARIAERMTTDIPSLRRETDVLPEAAGAGPPPRDEEHDPTPARDAPAPPLTDPTAPRPAGRQAPEYRVYRARPEASRRLHWKPILVTAAIAFALAAAVLTLPELIAGQSLADGDRNSTLFGGKSGDSREEPATEQTDETEPEQTAPGSQATEPDETVPPLQAEPRRTTPTAPETTTPPAQTTPTPRSVTPAPQQP